MSNTFQVGVVLAYSSSLFFSLIEHSSSPMKIDFEPWIPFIIQNEYEQLEREDNTHFTNHEASI